MEFVKIAKYEYEVVIYVNNTGSSLCFLVVDDFTVIVLTPTTTRLKQHCDNDIKCCTDIFSSPVSKQSFVTNTPIILIKE